jgi:hypothetical protein
LKRVIKEFSNYHTSSESFDGQYVFLLKKCCLEGSRRTVGWVGEKHLFRVLSNPEWMRQGTGPSRSEGELNVSEQNIDRLQVPLIS